MLRLQAEPRLLSRCSGREAVGRASGGESQMLSVPVGGAGSVVVEVDVGAGAAFWILKLLSSVYVPPVPLRATALNWCVPFANFVVSITQDMPSAMLVSELSAVESTKKSTRVTPEPLT